MKKISYLFSLLLIFIAVQKLHATDYYINSETGNDANPGTSLSNPFHSIDKINRVILKPGDKILFAAGQTFKGELKLIGQNGTSEAPIIITSYSTSASGKKEIKKFTIDAKGKSNGILIQNSSYIVVKHAIIQADGYDGTPSEEETMRVGVKVFAAQGQTCKNIYLDSLELRNIYFEKKGFTRSASEIKTANGTQRYGWGIRLIANHPTARITEVDISNCSIRDVSHTGIKLSGSGKNIHWVRIYNNDLAYTGGPGIQMSEVKNIHVYQNKVDHSGSNNDSRKWGRGSGLWTWGASQVLIEHNRFTNANGPGDSAGAHIDFNCDHVVLQYNFSANNAGGFCEILGNNYNCAYRYNISVNDGHRIKGKDGAFQEGKIYWLSGYQGDKMPKKGPVNSYFYNNTIYVKPSLISKIAIEASSKGILIANNIFCIMGETKQVLGDQNKADEKANQLQGEIIFQNNLWYSSSSWPKDAPITDTKPVMGDPAFKNPGGLYSVDYIPGNLEKIKNKGIVIKPITGDFLGLIQGTHPEKDILGNPVGEIPPIGAIVPN